MSSPSANSDRLRDLRRKDTPEEPAKLAPQEQRAPHPTGTAQTTPTAPVQFQPPNRDSRTPLIVALAVVSALVLTSLVVAIALQSQGSTPEIASGTPAVPNGSVDEPASPSAPEDIYAFDRPANVSDLIDKVTGSTFVIVCEQVEELGSGFAFDLNSIGGPSQRVVVTNHHVVVGCLDSGQIDVYQGDNYYPGQIESWDSTADLAIVSVSGLTTPALEPNFDPRVGQWVMAVGAPRGVENSASFGYITGILETEPTITSDAIIAGGSSGGPLVDNQGRVVAVNYAVWQEATGISLSAPIAALCLQAVECR